jgi:hypothetical protein
MEYGILNVELVGVFNTNKVCYGFEVWVSIIIEVWAP